MERKEYFNFLKRKAGYCGCKDLVDLAKQGKDYHELEKLCMNLLGAIAFARNPIYRNILGDIYKIYYVKKKMLLEEYDYSTQKAAKSRKIKLFVHFGSEYKQEKEIEGKEVMNAIKDESEIVTVNCARCNKVLEVLFQE